MRLSLSLIAVFWTSSAFAHWGHVGELAGHGHLIGIGALAGAAALAAALRGQRKRNEEAKENDVEAEGEKA